MTIQDDIDLSDDIHAKIQAEYQEALAEARKRLFAVSADYAAGKATFKQGESAHRRLVRIQEDVTKKANTKIMEVNRKRFPDM